MTLTADLAVFDALVDQAAGIRNRGPSGSQIAMLRERIAKLEARAEAAEQALHKERMLTDEVTFALQAAQAAKGAGNG